MDDLAGGLPKVGKWRSEATPNTDHGVPGLGRSGVSLGRGRVEVVTALRAEVGVGWGLACRSCGSLWLVSRVRNQTLSPSSFRSRLWLCWMERPSCVHKIQDLHLELFDLLDDL